MAQFIAKNPNVNIKKEVVVSFTDSMQLGRENRINILKKNGIDVESNDSISLQNFLSSMKEVAESTGEMNLFLIGKAITKNAKFPPMKDLEEALNSLNIAYHMNHTLDGKEMFDPATGKMIDGIGAYHVTHFDGEEREAVLVCDNLYPSKFDEGIITQIVRKFRPAGVSETTIKLDPTKENRKEGGESCTYLINW